MSPGQTGHITGQMGRVPGTDGTHTRGCPAKILYVYWFFSFLNMGVSKFCVFFVVQREERGKKDNWNFLFWFFWSKK